MEGKEGSCDVDGGFDLMRGSVCWSVEDGGGRWREHKGEMNQWGTRFLRWHGVRPWPSIDHEKNKARREKQKMRRSGGDVFI